MLFITCSLGWEASENGRVWKIYKDGTKQQDNELFSVWTETLDVLLVFVRVSIHQISKFSRPT